MFNFYVSNSVLLADFKAALLTPREKLPYSSQAFAHQPSRARPLA